VKNWNRRLFTKSNNCPPRVKQQLERKKWERRKYYTRSKTEKTLRIMLKIQPEARRAAKPKRKKQRERRKRLCKRNKRPTRVPP
jgi:hypothetical protein